MGDDRKYAAALGVFSQMVNDRRGAPTLHDALVAVLTQLETEVHVNGGLSPSSINSINSAIEAFGSKCRGGTLTHAVAYKGGVLTLNLTSDETIGGIDFYINLPAGITVKFANAQSGEVAKTAVLPSGAGAVDSSAVSRFTPANGTTPAGLRVIILNAKQGLMGEFMRFNFGGYPTNGLIVEEDAVNTRGPQCLIPLQY